ncbi:hypothetical protein Q8W71_03500 [Methylobacterium sp. NEAU 140]|uniref:hypothetical protein n=1 Tax=Methylobacterium sp. NEAU 140 TaxID=3064945 RepID=UPI0027361AD9|nr:hypothetical protein [Methylobacterium sp. NEAU 140]MDP4021679.1 hypothetical protein [Methylobacterium sp. NEAU 140]
MADIAPSDSEKLVRFALFQERTNPGGIGNECTHFVYAGLLEIRALDGMVRKDPQVATDNNAAALRWGRKVDAAEAIPGDVVQYRDQKASIVVYSSLVGSGNLYAASRMRGPQHTAITYTRPYQGDLIEFECHLSNDGPDQASYTKMQVRENRVFVESYAIEIGEAALNQPSSLMTYIRNTGGTPEALFRAVNWGALRQNFTPSAARLAEIRRSIKAGQTPAGVGIFFEVVVTGSTTFYRPQISNERRTMAPAALQAEKAKVVDRMKKTGRKGSAATGDSKTDRIAAGSFNWEFRDQ